MDQVQRLNNISYNGTDEINNSKNNLLSQIYTTNEVDDDNESYIELKNSK